MRDPITARDAAMRGLDLLDPPLVIDDAWVVIDAVLSALGIPADATADDVRHGLLLLASVRAEYRPAAEEARDA